ncbi:hypothetical protein DFH07DRAFT_77019 [Mycena maculata]|uniref:F-box domain-containing protein n=1 Tax=Mycena maculata TaxID=230809 RepID=A0AAD7IC18_9AGAR|nr:hypothetical protein DFH07DRAFT_77019 [Mycena maculata]
MSSFTRNYSSCVVGRTQLWTQHFLKQAPRPTNASTVASTPARVSLVPSPFQLIIGQETLPTASEKPPYIRDYVEVTDAEIGCRKSTINRLLCQLAQLHCRSEEHKASIAPIRPVPREVLGEIFMQLAWIEAEIGRYSPEYWDGENVVRKSYMVKPHSRKAPLLFGQVCQEWRNIALTLLAMSMELHLFAMQQRSTPGQHLSVRCR